MSMTLAAHVFLGIEISEMVNFSLELLLVCALDRGECLTADRSRFENMPAPDAHMLGA
jgi:hypothetical protein